ncbi:MAG TPA: CsgG/HfaB family protein [Candidatus Tyrphobacter sp.]
MRRILVALGAIASLSLGSAAVPAIGQQQPSIAVMNFSTQGLTGDWWGQFQPGVALSDLVTDELVNTDQFNVVERARLGDTLQEHQLDTSGAVDPETAVRAGRLVGAHFLVEGNVLQFEQTGASGANAGQAIGGILGGVAGGYHSTRVTIKVAVRIIDTQTGRIVQAFDDEQTQTANSWGAGGISYLSGTFGSYHNSNFTSSTMGHLIDAEAKTIAAHIDPHRLLAVAPAMPSLNGHIIGTDNGYYIINIGASRGVSVGQYFQVNKVMQVHDPSTGRYLTVNEPTGRLQVTSVSGDTAIARRVSGSPAKGQAVQSEP